MFCGILLSHGRFPDYKIVSRIRTQLARELDFPVRYHKQKSVVRKVLSQQKEMFRMGNSVPDRIVSIAKSYVCPIVRGKEVKKVEFGAKVNMIQVDGINFFEYLSFKPFNEGTRLIRSICYSRTLFGKITHVSADDIYATNTNRKYCTSQKITTNFKQKRTCQET